MPCHRRIDVALAFEVLDHVLARPIARAGARKISWSDRRLAMSARDVEHVARLAKPGQPAMERPHQSLAVLDGGAPMRGARSEIAVVEIVRLHAALDQGAHEITQASRIVVHAAQQHGLTQHGDAGIDQTGARGPRLGAELACVVGVQHHIGRLAGGLESVHE